MPIKVISGQVLCSNPICSKGDGLKKGLLTHEQPFKINYFASEIYCLECYNILFPNPIPFSSVSAEQIADIIIEAQRRELTIVIHTPESYQKFIKYFNQKPYMSIDSKKTSTKV